MFSLALAYFVANYFDNAEIIKSELVWIATAGIYVLIGMMVYQIFPVSLGFLFSADVLILHILTNNISEVDSVYKTLLIGFILTILYFYAWISNKKLIKKQETSSTINSSIHNNSI